MFYPYHQNTSGNNLCFDSAAGVGHWVIVEATNAAQADARAEEIGIYFDFVAGLDCECCGGRWREATDDPDEDFEMRPTQEPSIRGVPPAEYLADGHYGNTAFVHYADGRIGRFGGAPRDLWHFRRRADGVWFRYSTISGALQEV